MFKKVAFTMYPVQDAARARDFYETTLGLTPGSKSADGVWTEYDLPGDEGVRFRADMIHSPVCRMSVILELRGQRHHPPRAEEADGVMDLASDMRAER